MEENPPPSSRAILQATVQDPSANSVELQCTYFLTLNLIPSGASDKGEMFELQMTVVEGIKEGQLDMQ